MNKDSLTWYIENIQKIFYRARKTKDYHYLHNFGYSLI